MKHKAKIISAERLFSSNGYKKDVAFITRLLSLISNLLSIILPLRQFIPDLCGAFIGFFVERFFQHFLQVFGRCA